MGGWRGGHGRRECRRRQVIDDGHKHIGDEDNWADFLTKWVSAQKVNRSAAFLTNSRNRVPEGAHVPAG